MEDAYLTVEELEKELDNGQAYMFVEPILDERHNVLVGSERVITKKDLDRIERRMSDFKSRPLHVVKVIPHYISEDKRRQWTNYIISLLKNDKLFYSKQPRAIREFMVKYIDSLLIENDYVIWKISQMKNYYDKVFFHSVKVMFISLIIYHYYLHRAYAGMIDASEVNKILLGALLHDVGFLKFNKQILKKKRIDLSVHDIHDHPIIGYKLISEEKKRHQLPEEVKDIVLNHEERVDGTGYPRGFNGEDMSFYAKLVGLADYIELLLSNEYSYREREYRDYIMKLRSEKQKFDTDIFEAANDALKFLFAI